MNLCKTIPYRHNAESASEVPSRVPCEDLVLLVLWYKTFLGIDANCGRPADICHCKRNANLEFEAHRLKQLGILDTTDMEQVLKTVSCDVDEITCMYGKCQDCSGSKVPLNAYEADEEIWWWQWVKKRRRKRTMEEKVDGTVVELVKQFQMDVIGMKTHAYNIRRQYKMYRE